MVDKIWYNMEELIGGSEERGINRNILECKVGWKFHQSQDSTSINRNILECKEKRRGVCVTHTGGINRNKREVE